MPRPIPSLRRPTNPPPRLLSNSADEQLPDDDSDEFWDDAEPDDESQPLDDPDLEIDEEPDPDTMHAQVFTPLH